MKVQKQIEIRLLKKRVIPPVDVVQYDTGVQLVFSVADFTIPSGTTATLYVQKRSGKFVYQEENITVSGNDITIDLENQALTEHGETKYQITLKNGTDTVTTFAGVLRIEKSLADANAVESKTVVRAFDEAVADHVTEFQTKAEQIVAACIATIPDDYTTMEAKVNELANAVKGNLSGDVVFADDVSPVEHHPIVKVRSKNLFKISDFAPDNENTSFTFENDVLTVTGYYISAVMRNLTVGKTYTISFNSTRTGETGGGVSIEFHTADNVRIKGHYHTSELSKTLTFTVPENTYRMGMFLYGSNSTGGTTSATYTNLMLEESNEATEYTPYTDPSTVMVRRCGKNLTVNNIYDMEYGGITIAKNADGSFYATGTARQNLYFQLNNELFLRNGRYKLSGCPTGGGSDTFLLYATNDDIYAQDAGKGATFNFASDSVIPLRLAIYNGAVLNKVLFKPMIQLAEIEDDSYEKYEGVDYTPDSDGIVSGLTSVSPNMTILTDTEGVVVECEYNRDTNKVIEKLTNAIIALGGTV